MRSPSREPSLENIDLSARVFDAGRDATGDRGDDVQKPDLRRVDRRLREHELPEHRTL
jgi:hypothetical protein